MILFLYRVRKATVLDEDTYVETLDKIISRDYYPALRPLQDILGSSAPIRTSNARLSSVRSSFEDETPDVRGNHSSDRLNNLRAPSNEDVQPSGTFRKEDLRLDQFTHNFTSEDNESFNELVEVEQQKKQLKVFWLEENAKQAANHIINRLEEPKRTGMLDSWTYKVKNSLMFQPNTDDVIQEHEKDKTGQEHSPRHTFHFIEMFH